MTAVIETRGLTKKYGDFIAVDKLDLNIKEGEVFGFLGPNGSGKSTTIMMLLGLTEPTNGTAKVCGFDSTREPLKVKAIAGYLPENIGLYGEMTARENLLYCARLNGLPDKEANRRIEEALKTVGLSEVRDKVVDKFSRGMKQRLGIADLLIKNPRVVFLDEPTANLDPEGAREMLHLIISMKKEQGITVFISSHLLHQVQQICDRVAILSKGRKVVEGRVEKLAEQVFGTTNIVVELDIAQLEDNTIEPLRKIAGVQKVEVERNKVTLSCDRDLRKEILEALLKSQCSLLQMRLRGYGLEEIYLKYFQG